MRLRIDLADPSPEGAALAAGLRAAGHDVALRAIAEVPRTDADALVLAGNAEGALDALRALRDDGASPDTPVVLLGTPFGTTHRGEGGSGFGAQAVLLRPAALETLVETLARVLSPSDPSTATSAVLRPRPLGERTLELAGSTGDVRLESTLHLSERGTDPGREAAGLPALASVAPAVSGAWKQERTPSTTSGESGSSSGAIRGPTARISDRLRSILEAADRRVFPGRPPIDLSLPGGDEPAAELVPAELLEADDFAVDAAALAVDEDPIDAFTFVGGPVLPSAALPSELASSAELVPGPRGAAPSEPPPAGDEPDAEQPPPKTAPGTPTSLSRRPPRREPTAPPPRSPTHVEASESRSGIHDARRASSFPETAGADEREWPHEDSVLGRATPEGGRRGALAEGGALRLLLRASELRLDALVTIAPSRGDALSLTLLGGELARLEAPIAHRTAERLRHRGASIAPAGDEESAGRALDEAEARGAITRFERARAAREARLDQLAALVALERGTFSLTRIEPGERPPLAGSPLGAPLRLALVEAARRSLHGERARAVLGGAVTLGRGPRWEALAAEGLVAPEVAELLTSYEGATAEEIVAAAPDEPGLRGLLCALVAAGALVAQPAPPVEPSREEHRRLARRLLEETARVVEDADYFTILGVAADAADRDVERAHRTRRTQIEALALGDLGLEVLEATRRSVLESLDEAHRVLSNPRWRDAYARAIAHGERLAVPAAEH